MHRIPYPPNKGDKIRSFNLLKVLSKNFRVYLGTFVDDSNDWQYQGEINQYCKQSLLRPLNPNMAKLFSLSGLLTGKALSLPYYEDRKMHKWVNQVVFTYNVKNIIIYSSTMAQYVDANQFRNCTRIADFVDIDSDKWLQYSRNISLPMSWIYAREAKKLAQYEHTISANFHRTLFSTREEMYHFASLNPTQASRLGYYNNGVDTKFFDPYLQYESPYTENVLPVVFTGAMDYWANIEAVYWFAKDILPQIREVIPKAHFYIVGSKPTIEVKKLSEHEGITVTGTVRDIRPYLRYARVVVAPIRIARGVQNKVLEGMAMARPVVVTPMALEGIELKKDYRPLLANSASEFINQCVSVLQRTEYNSPQITARETVLQYYNWDNNLRPVIRLFTTPS